MDYSEVLEKYLYRIARGDLKDTSIILPLLLKNDLYLNFNSSNEDESLLKYSFPSIMKNRELLIPVYIKNNTEENDHIIKISGQVLLDSLPNNIGLIIEPNTSLEVIFKYDLIVNYKSSSNESSDIIRDKDSNVDDDKYLEEDESPRSKIRYLDPRNFKSENTEFEKNDFSLSNDDIDEDPLDNVSFSLFGSSDTSSSKDLDIDEEKIRISPKGKHQEKSISNISLSELEDKLKIICMEFPSLREAYSLPHSSLNSELVIGVLAFNWTSDDRFNFVEKVANLANDTFGYAGAIEVYDDLNDTHSKSWDLFKMIIPFYSQENNSSLSLGQKIEIEKTDNKENLIGSAHKVGRAGLKLLGK